jgi:hypothetical protein
MLLIDFFPDYWRNFLHGKWGLRHTVYMLEWKELLVEHQRCLNDLFGWYAKFISKESDHVYIVQLVRS